ncbi:MAG: hypothetical protein WAW59_07115 [Patescibacteria group bacterium]
MKRIILTAIGASLLMTGAASTYAISDTTDYAEKQAYEQSKSSQMRLEYYNKYKAKGYDVSLLTADILDGNKTGEDKFWYVLKQVQNNHEVPDRRNYVAKLKSHGYDVSGFTDTVIWDSGKFWEMVKAVEAGKNIEAKKEEVKKEEYKKVEAKKEEVKKAVETKKEDVKAKVEEKKTETVKKLAQSQTERLKTLMKARIAKLPTATRDATLARLEQALIKGIELARAKNSTILAARYEVLLVVVQEEMNNIDDEALIESIFAQ